MSIGSTPPRGPGPLNPDTQNTTAKGLSTGQKVAAGFVTLSAGSIVTAALVFAGVIGLSVVTFGVPLVVAGGVGLAVSLFGAKKLADRKVAQADLPKPAPLEMAKTAQVEPGKAGQSAKPPSQTYADALSQAKNSIEITAGTSGRAGEGGSIIRGKEIRAFVSESCSEVFDKLIATQSLEAIHKQLGTAAREVPDSVCRLLAECEVHVESTLRDKNRSGDKADFVHALASNGIGHALNGYLLSKSSMENIAKTGNFSKDLMANLNEARNPASPWHPFFETILERGRALLQKPDSGVDNLSGGDFKGNSGAVRDISPNSPTAFHAAPNTDNMSASHFSSSVATPLTQRPATPEGDSKGKVIIHSGTASALSSPFAQKLEQVKTGLKAEVNAEKYHEVGRNARAYELLKPSIRMLLNDTDSKRADGPKKCPTAKDIVATLKSADIEKIPAETRKFLASIAESMDAEIHTAGRGDQRDKFHQALHVNLLGHSGIHAYLNEEYMSSDRAAVPSIISALAKGAAGNTVETGAAPRGETLSDADKADLIKFYSAVFESGRVLLDADRRASLDATTF